MRSLGAKLTLSLLITSLVGVGIAALLAQRSTAKEFDSFLLEQQRADFVSEVTAYYQSVGSWAGVTDQFQRPPPNPPPQQPGQAPGANTPPPVSFLLVEPGGRVILPQEEQQAGRRIPAAELESGIPIEVDDQLVGYVITPPGPPERNEQEEMFLARLNQALMTAAAGAVFVALLLSIIFGRSLSRPIREITTAIRSIASGHLDQQVTVRSSDELGQLADAFNHMSADLARANALRRQMTADIAHDLRTPLTVISGYLESLRDGVLKPNPERFDVMYNEAQQLLRLVEDLRTLSLADSGELVLSRSLVTPRELLEQVAATFAHETRQKHITLILDGDKEVPAIQVDPGRMAQVLGNLVSNALRYTPPDGTITLSAAHKADCVLLTVEDTGPGISPEDLPNIFERFYRGDKARTQHKGDSGLGLAIARSIVDAHGGTISASSNPGAVFTITLPGIDYSRHSF